MKCCKCGTEMKEGNLCSGIYDLSLIHIQMCIRDRFTSAWSTRIDGVKLFEMMTSISKDTRIRYVNSKISMKLPKTKDWLYKMVEILERTDELIVKEA